MSHRSFKKIGLVSFPRYFNYGSQLQLFALQTVVEQFGYSCEVVDYCPPFAGVSQKAELRRWQWKRLKKLMSDPLRVIRNYPHRRYERQANKLTKKRLELYQSFQTQFIRFSDKSYYSYHEIQADPPKCDAFVVGSDQVWNPLSHFNDLTYYLRFTEESKRIAYAPSIGLSEIPEIAIEWMRTYINGIPHLSVREQKGAELIRQLTGRDAQVVLDPTLLLSPEEWVKIAVPPQRNRPYVLCYFLESDAYMRYHARNIARELACDLVVLPVNRCDIEDISREAQKEFDVGPREFLGLFQQAACVCTDSFHGTLFSLVFRRPFLTFRRYANHREAVLHSRIGNILDLTGFDGRDISNISALPNSPLQIDYTNIENKLFPHQKLSLSFLKKALEAATDLPVTNKAPADTFEHLQKGLASQY